MPDELFESMAALKSCFCLLKKTKKTTHNSHADPDCLMKETRQKDSKNCDFSWGREVLFLFNISIYAAQGLVGLSVK